VRIVKKGEEVLNFPGVCIFTRDSDGPFLDTGCYLNARDLDGADPYAYIHVQKVVDMGRVVGMVPKEEFERLQERVAKQDERVRELEALVDAYTTLKDAERELEGAVA